MPTPNHPNPKGQPAPESGLTVSEQELAQLLGATTTCLLSIPIKQLGAFVAMATVQGEKPEHRVRGIQARLILRFAVEMQSITEHMEGE